MEQSLVLPSISCCFHRTNLETGRRVTVTKSQRFASRVVGRQTARQVAEFDLGSPFTGYQSPQGGQRYSCTQFKTSALKMGVGGSAPSPGRFTPGKDPVPILQESGWVPGPVWTGAENLDPRTVQPVASRYTDCAIPAARICSKWE